MSFFKYSVPGRRNRLAVFLDFQNLALSSIDVPKMDEWLMNQVGHIAPETDYELFKAFCRPDQSDAVAELRRLKWKVKSSATDSDTAILQECKSYCGQNPDDTTLVMCSKDGDFANLIEEMLSWGVEVYVVSPHDASSRLIGISGSHRIQFPSFSHSCATILPNMEPVVIHYP